MTLHQLVNETRLLIAEWLIGWAVKVSPPGHPESVPIAVAAHHVAMGMQRTAYLCATDWEFELEFASDGCKIFPSPEDAAQHMNCVNECGLVEVDVMFRRLVNSGNAPWRK